MRPTELGPAVVSERQAERASRLVHAGTDGAGFGGLDLAHPPLNPFNEPISPESPTLESIGLAALSGQAQQVSGCEGSLSSSRSLAVQEAVSAGTSARTPAAVSASCKVSRTFF